MSIHVELDSGEVRRRLGEVIARVSDARPLMRAIAGILEAETEKNFADEGRPHWAPLAKSTEKARMRRNNGSSVLKILQDSGRLAASISTDYGPDHAKIGSNVVYAAIHQFGGTAGNVTIPSRPYLPFSGPPASATLQPSAERSIIDTLKKPLNGTTN
ncbi:MAG: phage virion morphogenesis protein [Azoarcus sp.]|jgi:phage virion morphogenesis protein|nr:phage virion morphogenesis protein [Azoarcus sp.]